MKYILFASLLFVIPYISFLTYDAINSEPVPFDLSSNLHYTKAVPKGSFPVFVNNNANIDCDPHAGCSDTQLGALRLSMGERIDDDTMRNLAMQQVIEVASVVMDAVTSRDLNTKIGMKSPTSYIMAYDSWREFTEQPDVYWAICGDIQIMANHAFASFGMEVRNVAMFENINYEAGATNNHASTEVWVYDRWVAVDLTFGMYFEGLLSWSEVREILLNGGQVNRVLFGNGLFSFDDYYIPLKELVPYMAIGSCPKPGKVCLFGDVDGQTWNGWLNITKGAKPVHWSKNMIGHRATMLRYWPALK